MRYVSVPARANLDNIAKEEDSNRWMVFSLMPLDHSTNGFTLTIPENEYIHSKKNSSGEEIYDNFAFIAGQVIRGNKETVNFNVLTLMGGGNIEANNIIAGKVKSINLYGGYLYPELVIAYSGRNELSNNEIHVKNVYIHDGSGANNRGNFQSKIIGAGEYFGISEGIDKYSSYKANALRNLVDINNSYIKTNVIVLGGGGYEASGNRVEIKSSHLDDFGGTLLGGKGVVANENELTISGNSTFKGITDSDELGNVGGGNGYDSATGNTVNLKGGDITGTFVGGASLIKASGNKVLVQKDDASSHLKLEGALIGGLVTHFMHSTSATELDASNNAIVIAQHESNDNKPLKVTGGMAIFKDDTASSVNLLSMDHNQVSITGENAAQKLTVGSVFGNYVDVNTVNIPSKITAKDTQITFRNVKANDVHALSIGGSQGESRYLVDVDANIYLEDVEIKGEVGVIERRNNVTLDPASSVQHTLELMGVNKIGTLGDDIKTLKLILGDANKVEGGQAVITFTSTDAKTYSDLKVTAELRNLTRARTMGRAASTRTDYLIFGSESDTGETTLSGTIGGSATFLTAEQKFVGTVANGSSLTLNQLINSASTPDQPTTQATPNAKTLSESLLGSVALIHQGAEFIADEGLAAMNAATKAGSVTAFGAMTGGHVRYETGSHVTMNGGSMTVGAATKLGQDTTVAGFVEFGKADSKAHVEGTKSDGDHRSFGVGVAARHDFGEHFYADTSLRVGRSETEFDGIYGSTGEKAHYDAASTYASAHLGGGYVFNLTPSISADLYARGIVTYLGSDTVSLGTTEQEKVHFDSTTAETLQLGARLKGNVTQNATWRAGAGWIHVFGGDADAAVFVDGLTPAKIESPTLSGNAAVFDAGFAMKPALNSPWTFDFAIKGYAGDRRGVTGTFQAGYRF